MTYHIESSCKGKPFYRGQKDVKWLLDSTFVRNAKIQIYGMQSGVAFHPLIQDKMILHSTLLNLFLTKFTYFINPSDELQKNEQLHDIDSWFEFFKQLQQDPGKWEHPEFTIYGTNILDWSQSKDIGIFFANEGRKGEGALWIYDKCVVSKSLMVKKTIEIINLMDEKGDHSCPQALGIPCIFHPEKQIKHLTASRQDVIYLAQMDMRYDLSQIGLKHEKIWKEPVFVKLALTFSKAGKMAEIPFKISPHVLRASAVTYFKQHGFSDSDIMRVTGHASSEMVYAYDKTELANNVSKKVNLIF